MNYKIFKFIILALIYNQSFGQAILTKKNKSNFLIEKIIYVKDKSLTEKLFFETIKLESGSEYSFEHISTVKDDLGFIHKKFIELYQGIKVENAVINIHYNHSQIYLINSETYKVNEKNNIPKISKNQAETTAIKHFNCKKSTIDSIERGKLVWISKNGISNAPYILAYKFTIQSYDSIVKKSTIYVNAKNSEILLELNRIHLHTVDGIGNTLYSGSVSFQIDSIDSNEYSLDDNSRGNGIHLFNLEGKRDYSTTVKFSNSSKDWSSNQILKKGANDIHWGTQKTYDYYLNIHNRSSIDGSGFELNSYYPYDTNFYNAFWNGNYMTYGSGSLNLGYLPLTSLDVIAHEISHGLTEKTAGLVYNDESGALNESYSDIIGKCVEHYVKPTTFNWIIGSEFSNNKKGFRNMADPNQNENPSTYLGNYWHENNDVHYNSAVQNFWFTILCDGKSGINDLGESYNVSGITIQKAEKIAFRTLVNYLSPNSTYMDARLYSIQSAIDLYGECSNEVIQTTNAWHAVGLGQKTSGNFNVSFKSIDSNICNTMDGVQFINTSTFSKDYIWNFGDGTTSYEENPIHTFSNYGNYTISLTASKCNNSLQQTYSKSNFIKIDSSSPDCHWIEMPIYGTKILNGCNFKIVDNGGLKNDYFKNSNTDLIIQNNQNKRFKFDIEGAIYYNDNLLFYNGLNNSNHFKNLTSWSKTKFTPFLSDSSRVKIHFNSDGFMENYGFKMNVSCYNNVPIALFSSETNNLCSSEAKFINESLGNKSISNTYYWNFGDGSFSTLEFPNHKYTSDGYFNVSLKVCNNYGCDSIIKYNYIYNVNDVNSCAEKLLCNQNQLISNCSGTIIDNGGTSNNYSSNCYNRYVFKNKFGYAFKYKFRQFKLGDGDTIFLTYYDNSIKSLNIFTRLNPPILDKFYSSKSNYFYIEFKSDSSLVDSGFEILYQCEDKKPVISSIRIINDNICYGTYEFYPNILGDNIERITIDYGDGHKYYDSLNSTIFYSHTYNNFGEYDVSVIACNSSFCDTLIVPKLVVYNNDFFKCRNILKYNYQNSETCSGFLVDDGDIAGEYKNNQNSLFSLYNPDSSNYQYKFHQFKLAKGDTLFIIDYITNDTTAKYYDTTLPNNGNFITSNSFQLQFYFKSDSVEIDSGFILEYKCLPKDSLKVDFINTNDNICSAYDYFISKKSSINWIYQWNLGDGNIITNNSNTLMYKYQNPGIYNVSLKICNNFDLKCDSIIKYNFVNFNPTIDSCKDVNIEDYTLSEIYQCQGEIKNTNLNLIRDCNIYFLNTDLYELIFQNFNIIDSLDYLNIYSGNSNYFFNSTNPPTLNFKYNINGPYKVEYYKMNQNSNFKFTYQCIKDSTKNSVIATNKNFIQLYPNPTSSIINIVGSSIGNNENEIIITDLIGRVVYNKKHKINTIENKIILDIHNLNSGLYIISLKNDYDYVTLPLEIIK